MIQTFLKRFWQVNLLVATLVSTSFLMANSASAELALSEIDRDLPDFQLPSLDGETWTPAKFEGKLTIVNFWATWCPPCVEEIPSMNALWQKLEGEGISMVAINAGEGEAAVKTFLEKVSVDFPIILGDGARTLPNWSVRGLPTTLIVNGSGKVIYEALGPRDWDDDEFVARMLALK